MAAYSLTWSREAGLSIIELIVFIVVIGIGVTGILSVMNFTTSRSADPMAQTQAKFIAEAYMDEILSKSFVDPTVSRICPTPPANRSNFDNVCDYNGLVNNGARDQLNNPIPGLGDYNVSVTVTGNNTVTLGFGAAPNNIVNASPGTIRVLRVDVTVTGPGGVSFALTGYRTNYNCFNAVDAGCHNLT